MKAENKVVIILFIMAFSTVFLLYGIISNDSIFDSSEESVVPTKNDIGKTVYVEGTVLSKRMTFTGDNLIVNIECKDSTVLMIFIPKSSGAASLNGIIEVDNIIGVKGPVEEYNGTLEVVLKNENNLRKIK